MNDRVGSDEGNKLDRPCVADAAVMRAADASQPARARPDSPKPLQEQVKHTIVIYVSCLHYKNKQI